MKERLVGAAVLVAIGAWLIPWVLDGPEEIATSGTTALELPVPAAENPPMRRESVELHRTESPVSGASGSVPAHESAETQAGADANAPARVAAESAVAPPAAATASAQEPDAAQGSAQDTQWFVQLGAFGDEDNAARLAERVGTYGFEAQVSAFPASGRVVHRVRVGPEPTREGAEEIASSLSAHGFVAQVVFQ